MTLEKNGTEKLSAEIIRACLPDNLQHLKIHVFDTIDSTNNYAKTLAINGDAGQALVLSDEQSAGRGRQGKKFYSPSGTGLYMSVLLSGSGVFCGTQMITVAAAVAVCRALASMLHITARIKWVNDIYCNARKVCGILCETVKRPDSGDTAGIVVGIGINCDTKSFPPEFCDVAGSLGMHLDRSRLAALICGELYCVLGSDKADVIDEYRGFSMMEGKRVAFQRNGKTMQAVAEGISDDGGLIVMSGCGERIYLSSGEVSVKGWGEWK